MFGNLLGWIISALIAVAGVFLGYQLLRIAQPTAATGWVQQTVRPLQMAESARLILDPMNDLKDDAGELYRRAIADYEEHKTLYQNLRETRITKNFDKAAVARLAGMDDLVKAAGCPPMVLFKSKPEDLVGFATTVPALDDLDQIAKSVESVIALAKYDKQYDIARKYANALAVLGYHLYNERVAYIELSAGEDYLGSGCGAMLEISQAENADGKIAAVKQFDAARLQEYSSRIEPVITVISGQGQQNIGEHAGDMFQLAGDPTADHVWRVEAIRKVGRLRFNAENRADQVKAPKFLAKLATDSDPIIRATAVKARDMTSYDNQSGR